jgi:hypothetical protein
VRLDDGYSCFSAYGSLGLLELRRESDYSFYQRQQARLPLLLLNDDLDPEDE